MRTLFAVILMALAFPAAAQVPVPPWQAPLGRNHPLVGRIWLPAEATFIEPAELARRFAAADFVLLGERHDNPDHHRLQAWGLAQIIAAGRHPVVAFEMVRPEQAPTLNRYLTQHPGDVDGLGAALEWSRSGWPAWPNYRPLFAEAVTAKLVIRPANLPGEILRDLVHGRPLPAELRSAYRLDQPLDAATRSAMADEIRQSHCGQLPEAAVPAMVETQRARDAAMAQAMTEDAAGGAVLIAGTGHTREDRGVPSHLRALAPGRLVFSLGFVEVEDRQTNPATYGDIFGSERPPFDAVWFTPRANNDDPCAAMAAFMKKKKDREKGGPRGGLRR